MAFFNNLIGKAYDKAVESGESGFTKYMTNVFRNSSASELRRWDRATGDGYKKHK